MRPDFAPDERNNFKFFAPNSRPPHCRYYLYFLIILFYISYFQQTTTAAASLFERNVYFSSDHPKGILFIDSNVFGVSIVLIAALNQNYEPRYAFSFPTVAAVAAAAAPARHSRISLTARRDGSYPRVVFTIQYSFILSVDSNYHYY